MPDTQDRKVEEQWFHGALRNDRDKLSTASNNKFYSVTRGSTAYVDSWLASHYENATILDYGRGEGNLPVWMADAGAPVFTIDISSVSLRNAANLAE